MKIKFFETERQHCNYRGYIGELTFDQETCQLRIHDGCTCGGKVLNEQPEAFDPSALEARLDALEGGTVSSIVQDANGDYVITYFDGTQAILDDIDVPEISAATDGDGLVTFTLNGVTFGPFEPGPHVEDTDTFVTVVDNGDDTVTITDTAGVAHVVSADLVDNDTFATGVDNGDGTANITLADGTVLTLATGDTDTFAVAADNGDGTVTVTYADGSSYTYAVGPHIPDTDTTYAFTLNPDGSFTATGSDGTVFTSAPGTVDTDTFATFAGTVITFANGDTLDVASIDTDNQIVSSNDGSISVTSTTQSDGQIDYDLGVQLYQDGGTGVPVSFNEVQPTLRDDCGNDLPKDTRVHTNLYPEAFTSGGSGADGTDVIATQANPIVYSSVEAHTFTNPHPCRTFQGSFTIDQSITARFPADGGYGRIATEYRIDGGAWVTANTEGINYEAGDDGDLKEFQLIDPQIPMALAGGASKLVEVRTRVQILFPTATQQMELLSRATAIRGAFNAQ